MAEYAGGGADGKIARKDVTVNGVCKFCVFEVVKREAGVAITCCWRNAISTDHIAEDPRQVVLKVQETIPVLFYVQLNLPFPLADTAHSALPNTLTDGPTAKTLH